MKTQKVKVIAALAVLLCCFSHVSSATFNYRDALSKSMLFLEAQRSGKLPKTHRVDWRGDSALEDGKDVNVNLEGGYYDAGDNVKYGLPLAFTVTTLSWNALQYGRQLTIAKERAFVRNGIKWGTDWLLKGTDHLEQDGKIYFQSGDPLLDHNCWERPEDMDTARTTYVISADNPGTEVVAEYAAALASASIVFRKVNPTYSQTLKTRAIMLYDFATKYQKALTGCKVYCSVSGFQDELLWAAAWLYRATSDPKYLNTLTSNFNHPYVTEFSWDLKSAGTQIFLADQYFLGRTGFSKYVDSANYFVCAHLKDSPTKAVTYTPGGLLFIRDGANTQYVASAAQLLSIYSDILAKHNQTVTCGGSKKYTPNDLMAYVKEQIDYLLGDNPNQMSYMVGFGDKFPQQPHHRAASIPAMTVEPDMVKCGEGYVQWFSKPSPNPNELTGAIVGGPDKNDNFEDNRQLSVYTESCTYISSCIVGPLAKLAAK